MVVSKEMLVAISCGWVTGFGRSRTWEKMGGKKVGVIKPLM